MSKDPAFLFYSQDFLTGVQDLTMEERGQYITMLCVQHQKGVISTKWLSICLTNASTDVLAKFEKDDDGNYFNLRLKEEMSKRSKFAYRKIASATLGGLISASKVSKAKKSKIKSAFSINDYKDLDNETIKIEVSKWFKHMLNYLENENDNTLSNKDGEVAFLEFWDLYGKKEGKATAEKKWNALNEKDRVAILAHVPKYVKATPEIEYRKNPTTYLNQRTWLDEHLPTHNKTRNAQPTPKIDLYDPNDSLGIRTDAEIANFK